MAVLKMIKNTLCFLCLQNIWGMMDKGYVTIPFFFPLFFWKEEKRPTNTVYLDIVQLAEKKNHPKIHYFLSIQ